MNSPEFLYYWLTFSILVLVFCGLIVYLAYRAGYFRDQDRARYLALWAEVPEDNEKESAKSQAPKNK